MSIRRGTPSIGHDEYDRPYIHWDDDPAGEFVAYADHEAALRACEQRVLDDDVLAAAYHGQAGYAAGVQAAREAVAAVSVRKDTSHDMRVQALAAIDALRGES